MANQGQSGGGKGGTRSSVLDHRFGSGPEFTVGVEEETNDLFVHKINLKPGEEDKTEWQAEELFSLNCPAWIRSIAE